MLLKTLSLLLFLLLGVTFAAAQDVKYQSAPGTDFSSYKTYKWQQSEKPTTKGGPFDQMVMSAIDAELAKKGLSRTESEDADLYIVYHLNVWEDMNHSSFTTETVWLGGYSTFPGFNLSTTNSSYILRKGHLSIDLYDTKKKSEVWLAEATKTLEDKTDMQKAEKNLKKVMAKVFKKYPPK